MFPKDHLINIIVSPLTATYLQPPIFLEDSPYIDSWINRVFSHEVTAAILCPKPVLWELNSFLMQTLSFVPINLHIDAGHVSENAPFRFLGNRPPTPPIR